MRSSFVFGVAFVHLVLLILGISCSNLGLISPIEVVEEWGCHDTEIRLTCGHLDSKLAILEATFTPNCTDDDCFTAGIKRLSGGYHSHRFTLTNNDPVVMETEAARKFLETLRKSHKDDEKVYESLEAGGDDDILDGEKEQTLDNSDNNDAMRRDPQADTLIAMKKKRTSLRASLERLIERYLRKLAPHNNHDCDLVKRSIRTKRATSKEEANNDEDYDGGTTTSERIILGARSTKINESNLYFSDSEDNKDSYGRIHESRASCSEQRHRISSLDRFHLEHSYKNESKQEINIRQTLNHRCSGKNHCSFIFALDHPYAKVFDSGVVRIKYICMEDFRINRYCSEHLAIGHEIDQKSIFVEPTKGEPVAEARIQLQEQSFHSLKILKSGDEAESLPGFGSTHHARDSRKRKIKVETSSELEDKQAQGVYSQDFKVLKILPSNIDDFNDIEKIGDEIYIRTDDDILNVPEAELGQHKMESVPVPTALTVPILPYIPKSVSSFTSTKTQENKNNVNYPEMIPNSPSMIHEDHENIISTMNSSQDFSKYDNITIVIREGEQYVVRFPNQPRIIDNLAISASPTGSILVTGTKPTMQEVNNTSASAPSDVTPIKTMPNIETDERHENNATMPSTYSVRDFAPAPTISEMGLSDLSAEASNRNYKGVENENVRISNFYEDDDVVDEDENIDNVDDDDDDDNDNDGNGDNELYEMESKETDYRQDKNKIKYTSIQRISYRRPLLHGFSMTPGYPKFYVGNWECKSVIFAPIGQKIRVTILDISLRYDQECKDYLRIVDLGYGQTLFNSCTEAVRPIEVVSESNQIEIIMKATSKFAFPKRGILLHYSALGCVDLPPPSNGHLVERNEKMATYECDPSFVFPDTAVNRRQLLCTERHTWDKILPDCIEEFAVIGRGFISGLNLNSHKRPSVQESTQINLAKMPTGAENQTSKSNDPNVVTDVIVPLIIIGALFLINGIVYYYIRLHRKRQSNQQVENRELAEL